MVSCLNRGVHDLLLSPEINPCDSSSCDNSGSCISMGPFEFTCECAAGYTGLTCEVDIDECLTAVCPSNSKCVDAINSYICVCNPGFEENQCTQLVMGEQGNNTLICVCTTKLTLPTYTISRCHG